MSSFFPADKKTPLDDGTELPPPGYGTTLPETFPVGSKKTRPVVSVDEVNAHLVLLGAFSRLKSRVGLANDTHNESSPIRLEEQDAWTVFLCRAVHRFQLWISNVHELPQEGYIPPLDVLMVWHSYLLVKPVHFEEDSKRFLPRLGFLDTFPLHAIASLLNLETMELEVSDQVRECFERGTAESWHPPIVTTPGDQLEITCPCCVQVTILRWQWLRPDGKGWAQRRFSASCPTCQQSFNHEAFGVRKFCDELVMWRDATVNKTPHVGLAGTQVPALAQARSALLMRQLFSNMIHAVDLNQITGAGLAMKNEWNMKKLATWASTLPNVRVAWIPKRVQRILSHYQGPGPFSVELTGAVMRQASFVQKMVGMGWTEPGRFSTDPSVLLRAIARYHAFLDLMSSAPSSFFVPTLSENLTFSFREDTILLLRRQLDHDDKVEEGMLSNAFDLTAQAWQVSTCASFPLVAFGVPYSVCGCVAPSSESSTTRSMIRGLKSLLPGSSKQPDNPGTLQQQPKNKRPDLVTLADGDEDATHPSDHNSVVIQGTGQAAKQANRRMRHDVLLDKRAKQVELGKADPWAVLQQRRAMRRREEEAAHDAAFYYPMGYWGVAPFPYGYYGYGGAACGSGGGAVMAANDSGSYAAGGAVRTNTKYSPK
ncbi:hypothetical protein BKA62DRAFT_703261 [Auriculariales sp. MPI-PUGE-AT-0066]|nr:hypothetical protein BKA62DRAFT_703261 [Auriculariales sp. MPI-PUGE-AT-0066]